MGERVSEGARVSGAGAATARSFRNLTLWTIRNLTLLAFGRRSVWRTTVISRGGRCYACYGLLQNVCNAV